ncbi:MAG: ABC transporter permease [Labilithrix sp.]|nr:ABC transporter permease [Labilithrix sp.]MCW5812543.1 ABC transporter permease [Labilithrix sp.]
MKALERKLLGDLRRIWAQAATIALVLACGVASFVAMRGAYASILRERDAFYAEQRFGDVFASVERAPSSLVPRLELVEGVARVHTRIVKDVLLPMEGAVMPSVGRIVSLPSHGEPPIAAPRLRAGRWIEPGRDDEVMLLESFAIAHELTPGTTLDAVIGGTKRQLRVVGVAMSPEYVFAVGPGGMMSDPKRFGVLWMDERAVAAAFRMDASFNDVTLALQPGANETAVVAGVREVLRPYGVFAAHGRARQVSNHVLDGELEQLSSYAVVAPAIFLGVAAFLINVVLVRTLSLQRAQIATLKALGYTDREIAAHYLELVLAMLLGGALLGVALGELLGRGMISLYRPFFRFPALAFRLDVQTAALASAISVAVGAAGAFLAIRSAVRIPPAEAMLPEAPARYRRPWLEALGLARLFGPPSRMVLRELVRRPLRAALSVVAIALATATVVSGRFGEDAVSLLFDTLFDRAQHDDLEVTFDRPLPASVRGEIAALPGVIVAEGRRVVPVRVRAGHLHRDVALVAHGSSAEAPSLRALPRWPMEPFEPPLAGVVVNDKLAEILAIAPGDAVELELLEGDRRVVRAVVAARIDEMFGLNVHASRETVRRLAGEEGNVSSVLLTVDPPEEDRLLQRLAELPHVVSIARRKDVVTQFHDQADHMAVTTTILTLMGATIAFGVVYNQARIALSTRSRDLASLRVLGFTRAEVSAMLLGELGVYVVLGVPLGWRAGQVLVGAIAATADPESYRMPVHVSLATYAFATLITVAAAAASALVVRRRVDQLDLVSVLKARE